VLTLLFNQVTVVVFYFFIEFSSFLELNSKLIFGFYIKNWKIIESFFIRNIASELTILKWHKFFGKIFSTFLSPDPRPKVDKSQVPTFTGFINVDCIHTCEWGERGGFTSFLGSRKMLLISDFWKINKKFWCKSFVLDINFKKFSVQMRMG